MALRTASQEAAFFLPSLRPGMRVLDLGCGPGSITVGIAEAIAPGEVVGVDRQSEQVEQARALGVARGVMNARFEVADVYRLPFPDGSFDAAFAHVVLMHLREPVRALAELCRVLRPGGFAGVRDSDWGARLHAPATPLLEKWYALTIRVRQCNGGDPFMGRNHRRSIILLLFFFYYNSICVECGDSGGNPPSCHRPQSPIAGLSPTALAERWMDQRTVEAVVAEIDAWAARPDALYVDTFCEALGWVSD